ncbi:MAG: C25 family cysteine peptidase, partial [Thermoflexales bacterium]
AAGALKIDLPGYAETAQPGAAILPFASVLVALPPGATPTLRILLIEERDIPLPGPLALAPVPEGVLRGADGRVTGGAFAPASEAQRSQAKEYPAVALEPAGVVRGVSLARLVFYPARPIGAELRSTTHVRVALSFSSKAANTPGPDASDPLLAALRATVINPTQVQQEPLPTMDPAPGQSALIRNPAGTGSAWQVEVAAPGLTAITREALVGAGSPLENADPRYLHLARAGIEVATEWDGDADAFFEAGERLIFYADPRFSRWTPTDVYVLWEDAGSAPLRAQDRPASPAGQTAGIAWADATSEVNQLYTPDCFCGVLPPGRDGDRWAWDDLKRPGHSTGAYPINLPALAAAQPATLTVWLIGYTDVAGSPDHRVAFDLNGTRVGGIDWNGRQAITATVPVTAGILHANVNTLTLTLPGLPGINIEGAWLDAFAIRYARGSAAAGGAAAISGQAAQRSYTLALASTAGLRVYDTTDPSQPLRLTGFVTAGNAISFGDPITGGAHRYALAAESGLRAPAALRPIQPLRTGGGFAGADYILIAPDTFTPALASLITLRQAQGLSVVVEAPQAIYAAYGDGRPDPAAIRAYLAHAYATWTPRPTYVLLVGDGSFDPRQYRAESTPTFIPPYLADVDPWAGETAADNRFVTVDGSDNLADMLIGRLPVKTLTETQTVVDKIVRYETDPPTGGWNARVVFVADDVDWAAGDFAAESELIATGYLTAPFAPKRVYYTPPSSLITVTQQAVLGHWNAGAMLIQFAGHSSWQQWAGESFFHLDNLPALNNGSRLPIVVEMTCFTGAFQRPEPTLDEATLTHPGGGAVAAWGATGLGISTGHASLDEGFFQAIFGSNPANLGQAAWSGKIRLAATAQNLDLLDTFTLLGDPALRPNRTVIWAGQTYLPAVMAATTTELRPPDAEWFKTSTALSAATDRAPAYRDEANTGIYVASLGTLAGVLTGALWSRGRRHSSSAGAGGNRTELAKNAEKHDKPNQS